MKTAQRIKKPVDWVLAAVLVLLFFTLFTCVIIQVFTRYVLNDPAIFTEEASRLAIIWLSLLGTAYACGRLEHMAYTMLPDALSPKKVLLHMRAVAFLVMGFACSVMVYGGGKMVAKAFQFNQLSATLSLPMGYVYLCIPISGALIIFYQLLILSDPEQFKPVDEVEAALEHVEEENNKLAAQQSLSARHGKDNQA